MKKHVFLMTCLILLVWPSAWSQSTTEQNCGLQLTEQNVATLYHKNPVFQEQYGDVKTMIKHFFAADASKVTTSKQLASGLQKAGLNIPDDYFDLEPNQKVNQSFADHAVSEMVNSRAVTIYYQSIWVTIFNPNNNTDIIADDEIYASMARLNQNFASNNIPIRFRVKAINRAVNSSYSDEPSDFEIAQMALFNRDPTNTSLHLYIVDKKAQGIGIWGSAPTPLYHVTVMSDEHIEGSNNWTTVTHEFGHVLGLLHTHQGKSKFLGHSWVSDFNLENQDMPKCRQEAVSRSKKQGLFCLSNVGTKKCKINGDKFCDTEASPRFVINTNYNQTTCDYYGTGEDNWGDRWRPQETNFMSYARGCRSKFTAEQVAYMVSEGQPTSWASTTTPGYSITGNSQPCTGGTYTYSITGNLPVGVNRYNWEIPIGWNIIGSEHGSSIQVSLPSNASGGQIVVVPNGINIDPISKFVSAPTFQIYRYPFASAQCTGEQYSLSASGPARWSFSNSGWTINSGQNTSRITFTAGSSTNTIRATSLSCGTRASQVHSVSDDCGIGIGGGPIRRSADKKIVVKETSEEILHPYPNPSNGQFTLTLNENKLHKIVVYQGSKLVNEFYTQQSTVELSLPNSSMPYLVTIQNDKTSKTVKLISK